MTNTATRDTLNIVCNPLDSMGNPTNLADGDSIWLTVIFPGGAAAYQDSSDWNDAHILRLGTPNGPCSTYIWMDQIQDIDGAGVDGVYTYHLVVYDQTSAALKTQYAGHFQIVNSTLESSLDSAGLCAVDAQAILDTLQLWDTRIDSIEAALADASIGDKVWTDGTPTNRVEINDILDSLQLYDTRFDSLLAALADGSIGDKVWDALVADHVTANTYGDTLLFPTVAGRTLDIRTTGEAGIDFANVYGTITEPLLGSGAVIEILDSLFARLVSDTVSGSYLAQLVREVAASLDTLQNQDNWVGNMRYSYADSILALRGLHIRGTTGNDTTFIAHGYGTGNGASFYGGASNATGFVVRGQGSGSGAYILGGASGHAINILGGAGGHGVKFKGGENGDAIYLQAGTGGYDVELCGSGTITTGAGNVFMTTDYDALTEEVWRNKDTTNIDTSLIGVWLSTGISASISDAAMAAIADSVWNEDSTGHYTSPHMAYLASQTGAGESITDADMAAIADSVWQALLAGHDDVAGSFGDSAQDWGGGGSYIDSVGKITGYGTFLVNIYALDTSGTDTYVPDIRIEVWNSAETYRWYGFPTQHADSAIHYNLAFGTYIFKATGGGYWFDPDTVSVIGAVTCTLQGYNLVIDPPGGDSLCRCYTYAYDGSGNGKEGAQLIARLVGRNVQDTCNDVTIVDYEVEGAASDTTGYVYIDLKKSKCLSGYNKWKIGVVYGGSTDYIFMDTIPGDQTTFLIKKY
jgi:hypothetical protein